MKDEQNATSPSSQQIAFIHTLRGIAVLLVIWAHLGGWWLGIASQESILQQIWIDGIVRPLHLYQDGGHLGVLIFFLVSGYIITHVSLRETRKEFLIKRTLRLAPTLLIAILFLPILRTLSDTLGLPAVMGNESQNYLSGILFLNYMTGTPQVLTVLWTLFIEILFYSLTAIFINKSRSSPILSTWYMIGISLALHIAAQFLPSMTYLMWSAMYIPFLILGRCIYLIVSEKVDSKQAFIVSVASYGVFLFIYSKTAPGRLIILGAEPIISHAIAIVLFVSLCFSNLKRTFRPIAFIADISYPIYLLHAPLGGFLLYILTGNGLSYEISLIISLTMVTVISALIFKYIEKPAQTIARKMSRRVACT